MLVALGLGDALGELVADGLGEAALADGAGEGRVEGGLEGGVC
jgi:hypothetical protein